MELHGGPPAMAVRAADIAFLDLRKDPGPAFGHHHCGDVIDLERGNTVIELQRNRLAAPAINAGMRLQVEKNFAPVLLAAPPHIGGCTSNIVRLIGLVVPAPVRRLTRSTVEVQRASASI